MVTRIEFWKQYNSESESSPLEANPQSTVNPSVSLKKTNRDASFTPVCNVEVKLVLFCGCRFESVII